MSDRLAVMNHGRIRQLGTPRELYEAPVERYVADFVGVSNFFPGRVVETGSAIVVELSTGHSVRAVRPTGAGPVVAGDAVTVAVRPERVRVGGPEGDGVPGRLVEETFLGDATDLLVRTDALGDVLSRRLNGEPGATAARFAVGDLITVAWDDAAALALTD